MSRLKDIRRRKGALGVREPHKRGDEIFALETNLPSPLPTPTANRILPRNCPTPLSFYYHFCLVEIPTRAPGVPEMIPSFPAPCCNGTIAECEVESFQKERQSRCRGSHLSQAKNATQGLCSAGSETHLDHCPSDFILEPAKEGDHT